MKRLVLVFVSLLLMSCGAGLSRYGIPLDRVSGIENATAALIYSDNPTDLNGEQRSYCSGVFVSTTHVLTAQHCLGAPEIRIGTFWDSEVTEGKFYGQHWREYVVEREDRENDLALLRYADSRPMPEHAVMQLAPTSPVLGERVMVSGHPAGLTWTFTVGMVSSPERHGIGPDDGMLFVQHQAPAFYGNSGGPVVDFDGNLVGIVSRGPTFHLILSIHSTVIRDFLEEEHE